MLFTSSLSRRSFVCGAAAVAGAVALGSLGVQLAAAEDLSSANEAQEPDSTEMNADVIVIGSGAAGLAAAAKAAQDGARVIVLEAESSTGGTTKLCGGHWKFIDDWFLSALPERTEASDAEIAAILDYDAADFGDFGPALTTCQEQIRDYLDSDSTLEFDSVEYWLVLHYIYSKGTDKDGKEAIDDYDVVSSAYYNSGTIAAWLADAGLTWSDPQADNRGEGGPLSVEPEGQGMGFIDVLEPLATNHGATIVLDTKACELLTDETGRVCGVVAEANGKRLTYTATKGVVLACGGYASNGDMVAEENRYEGIDNTCPSCEPASCDGTGIKMALSLGASVVNTEFVQFMGFPANQYLSIESLFPLIGATKMMVNMDAQRFTDDSNRFYGGGGPEGVRIICDQPSGRYYLVGDDSGLAAIGSNYDTYVSLGVVCPGDTIADAAEAAGIDGEMTQATVNQYNEYVADGTDPEFDRNLSNEEPVSGESYIVIPMAAYAQNTMGGVVINSAGEVVGEDGEAIPGLYAAGEVVGNTDGACRRHGDNFAHLLWYGYLAGKTLAAL